MDVGRQWRDMRGAVGISAIFRHDFTGHKTWCDNSSQIEILPPDSVLPPNYSYSRQVIAMAESAEDH
jgi:hypothetical protein